MTNTTQPMTSREAFEKFDREHFGKKDMPISYETWEEPLLGTRYVDAFVQTRYAYYLASEANQQAEMDALKFDLDGYMKVAHASATEIVQQAQTIAELVEALEDVTQSSCRGAEDWIAIRIKLQKTIAKVKGK